MKALDIFTHSVRQVTGNLDGALRVSVLPILIQMLVGLAFAGSVMMRAAPDGMGIGIGGIIVLVVAVFTAIWLAVAWHRYVLLNEHPKGYVPAFQGDKMLAYFLRSLGYGAIVVVAGAIWGSVVGMVLGPFAMRGGIVLMLIVMAIAVQLPLLYVGFRLTAILPGAAIGAQHGFLDGWHATKEASPDILMLAAIAVGAHLVLALLGFFVFDPIPAVSILWNLAVTWLVTMVGASILTTLYGHYIEKRPLV